MRRKKEKYNANKRKTLSIIGFIISIILLSVAITISMNEEKVAREAKLDKEAINLKNTNKIDITSIYEASYDLNKRLNEIEDQNKIESNTIKSNENIINNNTISSIQNEIISSYTTEENKINEQSSIETSNGKIDNESKNEESNTKAQFVMPVEGASLNGFSMEALIYSNTLQEWVTHRGLDIKAEKTSIVKASAGGKISAIKDDPRYGLSIIIEHNNGFKTVYSSLLSTEFIKEGDIVEQGQAIGTVGNSAVFETADGSHLHFEIIKDGEYINPDIYIK